MQYLNLPAVLKDINYSTYIGAISARNINLDDDISYYNDGQKQTIYVFDLANFIKHYPSNERYFTVTLTPSYDPDDVSLDEFTDLAKRAAFRFGITSGNAGFLESKDRLRTAIRQRNDQLTHEFYSIDLFLSYLSFASDQINSSAPSLFLKFIYYLIFTFAERIKNLDDDEATKLINDALSKCSTTDHTQAINDYFASSIDNLVNQFRPLSNFSYQMFDRTIDRDEGNTYFDYLKALADEDFRIYYSFSKSLFPDTLTTFLRSDFSTSDLETLLTLRPQINQITTHLKTTTNAQNCASIFHLASFTLLAELTKIKIEHVLDKMHKSDTFLPLTASDLLIKPADKIIVPETEDDLLDFLKEK